MNVLSRYLLLFAVSSVLAGTFFFSPQQEAEAQTIIDVNETAPCFLNYTAGAQLWKNCGADEDYIQWALQPWEYITGGYFSMILVSIFIVFTYVKYQKLVYPIVIGIVFLPISWYLFPQVFLVFSMVMAGFGICVLIYFTFIKQTKEY